MNSLVWEKCHRDAYPGMCIIHSYAAPHLQNEKKYPRKPYTAPTTTRCRASAASKPRGFALQADDVWGGNSVPCFSVPCFDAGAISSRRNVPKVGPPRCSSSRALMMKSLGWIRNYLFFDSNDCHLSRSTFGVCVSALWMTVSDSKYTV